VLASARGAAIHGLGLGRAGVVGHTHVRPDMTACMIPSSSDTTRRRICTYTHCTDGVPQLVRRRHVQGDTYVLLQSYVLVLLIDEPGRAAACARRGRRSRSRYVQGACTVRVASNIQYAALYGTCSRTVGVSE
jgi:hypothetical protein